MVNFKLVPETGIEPVRCCHRGILSPVRLPIPPPGQLALKIIMEGGTGFEPVNGDFADHSVSLFATRPINRHLLNADVIISTFHWHCNYELSIVLLISNNVIL